MRCVYVGGVEWVCVFVSVLSVCGAFSVYLMSILSVQWCICVVCVECVMHYFMSVC